MRIEVPHGSGNFINIFMGGNGDLCIRIEGTDCTGFKFSASVELFGHGKGYTEPENVQRLYSALRPFAD